MLSLIGLGVANDITRKGIEELEGCDSAFCEVHTMPVSEEYVGELEKICGKKIGIIMREEVEGDFLIEKAKREKVCLLCGGDPLAATTHVSLIIDAKKEGIETRVVHNSSILSAACGKSGLQPYRFGKTVTVSFWRKNYEPTSPLLLIEKNLEAQMHTLVLMDLDRELGMMDARQGLGLLLKMQEREGRKVLPGKAIVLSRVGYPDEKVSYGEIGKIMDAGLGSPPFCIVIPSTLHEMEEEYLGLL